jgi:hypothetical protein|tara:strand:+ start:86 stop:481 length:396 start_codon:yes stop_codon:yes gene_type:complete
MKKFTKVLEDIENGRFFKVNAEIELILPAENEGEAGYLSDSILSSIEYGSNYQINNIDSTEERIEENMEIYQDKQETMGDGKTPEEIIELAWKNEFGDAIPDIEQRMEFYHDMRSDGYETELIFKSLKGKF